MQPVKIHIYSQSHSSAGTENIETTAYGRLAEKNNKYYVFYDESEAAGLAGTKTTIKWDYERVIILRSARWIADRNLPEVWSVKVCTGLRIWLCRCG